MVAENDPRATILIVDDTPENLHVLGDLLRSTYVVRVANSGARALEVAATAPRPDLILLDVMMPEMDGYECMRHLRDNPATRDIPVIFVTALSSTQDERFGLELGAVDYITKPIRPAIVRARVRNHLEMKRARDWLQEQNSSMEAELGRFMEILAHHLQEPVRRQITYSQLLRRSLPKPINECADSSLAQILEGATRLRAMLRDVLLYLAAHQFPRPDQPCSAQAACAAACRQVGEAIRCADAQVEQGTLPTVWVGMHPLTDIFRALLDNAVAYRRPDRRLRIRMDAETRGAEILLSVTDNGMGIPAEFRERVFRIFERLHGDQDLPGTGIGLSLVKRIVEMAKGRVWIEDGDDGGTRVCFVLPAGGSDSMTAPAPLP